MSDHAFVVVDTGATLANAEARGAAIVALLRVEGILGEETLVDRMVGNPFEGKVERIRDRRVWTPGPRALEATTADVVGMQGDQVLVRKDGVVAPYFDFRRQNPSHVDLEIGWRRHSDDEATVACSACQAPWSFDDEASRLDELGGDAVQVTCPTCSAAIDVRSLRVEPRGTVAALAIVFWSWWPLRPEVLAKVAEASGTHLVVAPPYRL